ncbi:hypothetical protein FB45DRAFT_950844 [Roridomyces roridus]|uniref:F-box domain-containing protein n=1 Tax=Roridomyces roridus TaxID=1738132 RepID=A0AAD7B078_9AGAR|nr:hypothetical protein FB45DRAFT_950844 [Roridomyces roridus]
MTPRRVPDEILHEIFSSALSVPDETFSSHRSASVPPEAVDEPGSSILLVCKRWLRIATPLLYKTVILRSRGQAQALELALRSNPQLGLLIKQLRIEGGYGVSMYTVLRAAKNLADICVSLDLDEKDSSKGLCHGLKLISPARLVLVYYPAQFTIRRSTLDLIEAVVTCIPKWNNLAVVEMPHDSPEGISDHNDVVAKPLKSAKNLRSLVLSGYEKHLFADGIIPQYISDIASNPYLQEIRPKVLPRKSLGIGFAQVVQGNPRLSELFDLRRFGISPFVYPAQLTANPQLEDTIWDRILSHLFQIIHPEDGEWDEDDEMEFELPPAPMHVRRLSLLIYGDYADSVPFEDIVTRLPGLLEFKLDGHPLYRWSWKVITELAMHCGGSLQTFQAPIVGSMAETIDPSILAQFPRMRSFTWDCEVAFDTAGITDVTNMLSQLKDLSIGAAHPSFHTIMSQMQLPALRSLKFNPNATMIPNGLFLPTHGGKLEELTLAPAHMTSDADVFTLCPSIKVLTIRCRSGSKISLGTSKWRHPHRSIERIVLWTRGFVEDTESRLVDFLASIDPTLLPALREIQHDAFDWTSVHKPPSSLMVQWANHFIARNIHLVHEKGGRWRPRRQYVAEKEGNYLD